LFVLYLYLHYSCKYDPANGRDLEVSVDIPELFLKGSIDFEVTRTKDATGKPPFVKQDVTLQMKNGWMVVKVRSLELVTLRSPPGF
jgi:hypothetical protein